MPRGRKKFCLGDCVYDRGGHRWGFVTVVRPGRMYTMKIVGFVFPDLFYGDPGTYFASELDRCVVSFVGPVKIPFRRRNRRA